MSRTLTIATLVFTSIPAMAPAQQTQPAGGRGLTLLDAVQSAITHHPTLRAQQAQVEISQALREEASGIFDLTTQGNINQQRIDTPLSTAQQRQNEAYGVSAMTEEADQTAVQASVSKLFSTGITASSSFQMSRVVDNILSAQGINSSSTLLTVTLPLLRGRGRAVVAAQQNAAGVEVTATTLDLNQLISQLMANAASSYWNWLASRKALVIAQQAEERGTSYYDTVQTLIDADHAPRNDLNEVRANLEQRTATRIAAEQQVAAEEQQLYLDMGLSAAEMLTHITPSQEDFPDAEGQALPSDEPDALKYYLDQALERRGDFLSSKGRIHEQDILLTAAQNRLKSQLDLSINAGYAGVRDGLAVGSFLAAPGTDVAGPSLSGGVNYTFFAGNHAARGALRQMKASRQQVELQSEEVSRNISANVVVAVRAVRNSILHVRSAREAVGSYQAALSGEREKYRLGMGSVVDILTVEDKLNSAQTDQIQAQLAYALALTQFRFATGTLMNSTRMTQGVRSDVFLTLPFTGAPGSGSVRLP